MTESVNTESFRMVHLLGRESKNDDERRLNLRSPLKEVSMRVGILLISGLICMAPQTLAQRFPSLGIDQSLLERAQQLEIGLTEAQQAFERACEQPQDPRQVVVHTRVFLIAVLALRNNLASRYDQRANAPVSPPISEAESQKLLQFIRDLMNLEAQLLGVEESALQEIAKRYPSLKKSGAIAKWLQMNQAVRERLRTPSVRTGLAIEQFPRVRWGDCRRVAEHARNILQGCEYVPARVNEHGEVVKPEVLKLPSELERFAKTPLPWRKEDD